MTHATYRGSVEIDDEAGVHIGEFNVIADVQSEDGSLWIDTLKICTYRDHRAITVEVGEAPLDTKLWRMIGRLIELELLEGGMRPVLLDLVGAEEEAAIEDAGGEREYRAMMETM